MKKKMTIKLFRKKPKKKFKSKWSLEDFQSFADRNILRSKKVPSKKKPLPDKNEWD